MKPLRTKLALLLASLFAATAHAQAAGGVSLPRFDPAPRGSAWFALDSLELKGHLAPSVGLLIDWGYKPLVIYNADGSERAPLVEHQAIAHLGAGMVFWNRLRLAFDLPYAALQRGTDSTVGPTLYRAPDAHGLGDVRVSADLKLTGAAGDGLSLAVGLAAQLPSGQASAYLGDGGVKLIPRLQLAGAHGPLAYAANLGFTYSSNPVDFGGARLGSGVRMGLAMGLRALGGRLTVGPELYAGSDLTSTGQIFEKQSTPFEGLLGLHCDLGAGFRLGAGAGAGFSRALGTPKARGLLSLDWSPATGRSATAKPADADQDGIADPADACPEVPGVASSDRSQHGCPAQPKDTDDDGITDDLDACREVAGRRSKDPKQHGCPPPDRDGDTIPDTTDACPELAGVADPDLGKHGCPPPADKDQDGLADRDDACPDEPAGATPDPTRAGCPLRDQDRDTVADSLDNCPLEKGPASNQGCPKKVKQLVIITRQKLEIADKVYFATNKATLLKKSHKLLAQVAKVLALHPEIATVVVEGHTDDRGKAERNRTLSRARAEAVRDFLVRQGVAAHRLQAMGFGPDRPVQTNNSARGREANRRVEFTILGVGEHPPLPETRRTAPAAIAPAPLVAPSAEKPSPLTPTANDLAPLVSPAAEKPSVSVEKPGKQSGAAKTTKAKKAKRAKAKKGQKKVPASDDLDTTGLMELIQKGK